MTQVYAHELKVGDRTRFGVVTKIKSGMSTIKFEVSDNGKKSERELHMFGSIDVDR